MELSNIKEDFFQAVCSGDTVSTKHLLSTGCIDVNCVDDSGFTALHHAASLNNATMIRLLHTHQANINARMEGESGAAPIHVATMYTSLDAIVTLHQLGCNISAFDDDDLTPLHYAVESEDMNTVSLLLKLNANVTACGSSGAPLHIAAKKDNLEIIQVLVQNGHPADIDMRDTEDYTPLHVAAQNGCDRSAALLVSMGANVCSKTAEGQSACELAMRSRCPHVVNILANFSEDVLSRFSNHDPLVKRLGAALHYATKRNRKSLVNYLLKQTVCPPDVEDNTGRTALIIAITNNNLAMCRELISLGANVNHVSKNGVMPILTAAFNGYVQVVKELIQNRAEVDKVSRKYGSALHQAASGGHTDVGKILLAHGCPIDIVDSYHFTVLMWATEEKNLATCQEIIAQDQLCYKKLLALDIIGGIAWSVASNRKKIVQFLIETLDLYRTHNMTELAMTFGIPYFIFYSSMKKLLLPAIKFNNRYCWKDEGDLPGFLHVAAINGNVDVFSILSDSQVEKQIGQLKDVTEVYSMFFKDNFPEGYSLLNPLHISLLMMGKQGALPKVFNLNDKVIPVQIHDYTVFCDRLITACSSIVNDPLPDGRTPLDLARDLGLNKMALMLLNRGGQTNPFLGHPNARLFEQLEKTYRITGIASALKQHTAQTVMSFRSGQELEASHLKSYLQNKPKLSEITDIALSLISDRWLTVGRLLGVDEAFLETTIEAEDTNEKKCRRVLKWWLENCTSPSWSELLSVIEQTDAKQLILERLRSSCSQPSAQVLPFQHSISEPHRPTTFESPHPHHQCSHPLNTTGSGLLPQDHHQLLLLQQTQVLHNSNNTHHHYYPQLSFPQLPPCPSPQLQLYNPHPPQYHNDHPSQSPNIYELQRDLVDRVAAEWYKLGIVLQVEMYVLNNITVNSVQQGVEKCCMDLFMRWLRGDKGTGSLPRTWDTIISAVEEIDPPLARELHSKYKTGCQKP